MAIGSTTVTFGQVAYATSLSQVTSVYNPNDLNAAAIRIAINRAIETDDDVLLNTLLASIYDAGQTVCVNSDSCDSHYCKLPYYTCDEIMNIDVAQYDPEYNDWDNKWSVYVRDPEAVDNLVRNFISSVKSRDQDGCLYGYLSRILDESECETGPSAYLTQRLCDSGVNIRFADQWMDDESCDWVNEYEVTIDGVVFRVQHNTFIDDVGVV